MQVVSAAVNSTYDYRHEFVTPEHLLLALMVEDDNFSRILNIFYDADTFLMEIEEHLGEMECMPDETDYNPEFSVQMCELLDIAFEDIPVYFFTPKVR